MTRVPLTSALLLAALSLALDPTAAHAVDPIVARDAIEQKYGSLPTDVRQRLGWPAGEITKCVTIDCAYKGTFPGRANEG